jgi:hydrogenase large subunit
VPTTWNFSPMDDKGNPGPLEKALIGVPIPDSNNPINIVRVIRSFDPCLACAIHLIDPKTNEVLKYRIG